MSLTSASYSDTPASCSDTAAPMSWQRLLSSQRFGKSVHEKAISEQRSEFQRDFDRLIFSPPFRRMQNKTQVFPLPGSVFVHNRLTHSLEVSSVGRSLGAAVAHELLQRDPSLAQTHLPSIDSIVSAACLAHDMGNPPFGHSGEAAICSFFAEGAGRSLREQLSPAVWADVTHFDGNANAFRLLTHQFLGRRRGGFVLTYSTLAAIVKYPYSALLATKKPKFGFFESEKAQLCEIFAQLGIPRLPLLPEHAHLAAEGAMRFARHPLVYLVEAADDICYQVMDIEDACKLHILTQGEAEELLLGFFEADEREKMRRAYPENTDRDDRLVYYRSCAIGAMIQACVRLFVDHEDEILRGCYVGTLIDNLPAPLSEGYARCAKVARQRIYTSKKVVDVELSGYHILYTLLEKMVEAITTPDTYAARLMLKHVPSQYAVHAEQLEERLMAVLDYLSGMTDLYALDLYRKIQGQQLPMV